MTQVTNITFSRSPIGTINIEQDGDWYALDPQEDITPLESLHLSIMLKYGESPRMWDWLGYIKEKGLERHWKKQ